MVAVCRRYLPFTSCMLDDPRVELRFEDGVGYVERTPERFDVAIIDSTDPVGPGAGLFAAGFYEKIAGLLTDNGIMVTQAECAFLDADDQRLIFGNQRPYFKHLHAYLYPTLSYPGALYTFGFASRNLRPLADFDAKRVAAAKLPTRYYNAGVHSAAFQLPNLMAQRHRELIDPLC